MMPIPFCFISITTAAMWACPGAEQPGRRLINFARNIGGSILIAVTTLR